MIVSAKIAAAALLMAVQLSGRPPYDGPPPRVVKTADVRALDAHLSEDDLMGITSIATGDIYLYPGWRWDAWGKCILVHEMTHFLQIKAGEDVSRSTEAGEVEAWEVQARCYEQEGRKDWAEWARQREAAYLLLQGMHQMSPDQ